MTTPRTERSGSMSTEPHMSKAERLAIAGAIAPRMRETEELARTRRVRLYNQQTGEETGSATLADARAGILKRAGIELETRPGVRPSQVLCLSCRNLFKTRPGPTPKYCHTCKAPKCKRCDAQLKAAPSLKKGRRRGLCFACWRVSRKENTARSRTCSDCGGPTSAALSKRCRDCYAKRRTKKPRARKPRDYAASNRKAWETRRARILGSVDR